MRREFKNVYIDALSKTYTFENESEVSKFLFDHTYLVDLLFDAAPPISRCFPASEFRLSVNKTGILNDQIMVRIYNDKDPDDNDMTLERLDNSWWKENLPRARGKLVITA